MITGMLLLVVPYLGISVNSYNPINKSNSTVESVLAEYNLSDSNRCLYFIDIPPNANLIIVDCSLLDSSTTGEVYIQKLNIPGKDAKPFNFKEHVFDTLYLRLISDSKTDHIQSKIYTNNAKSLALTSNSTKGSLNIVSAR
ncbi:MAG: hypothetical protein ACXVHN_07060 [Methanobacterium sp.]